METHLVEADGRHSPHVQLFLKLLGDRQLFFAETVVSEQHAHLHGDLDQVFDDFLSFAFVARVLFGDAVQFVQDLTGGVVDEHLHRALGGHGTEDLLLGLHGHVLGTELHDWLKGQREGKGISTLIEGPNNRAIEYFCYSDKHFVGQRLNM